MKKVLITGSRGIVGSILADGLNSSHDLSLADLPESDLRSYDTVLTLTQGQDAIVHLAWNTQTENGDALREDPGNTEMCVNVYRAALENGVPRVIMASSVHATDYMSLRIQSLSVSPGIDVRSKKVYGRHKRSLEREGKIFAAEGLEVVCVRLGGVCAENGRPWEGLRIDGLATPDLVTLFQSCLDAETVPKNYTILYGVSENGRSTFDLSNPFGWQPKFNAAEFYDLDN